MPAGIVFRQFCFICCKHFYGCSIDLHQVISILFMLQTSAAFCLAGLEQGLSHRCILAAVTATFPDGIAVLPLLRCRYDSQHSNAKVDADTRYFYLLHGILSILSG